MTNIYRVMAVTLGTLVHFRHFSHFQLNYEIYPHI